MTAVNKVLRPSIQNAPDYVVNEWQFEYTIETAASIYVVNSTVGRPRKGALPSPGLFKVGDAIHFQVHHSHNTGLDLIRLNPKPRPFFG